MVTKAGGGRGGEAPPTARDVDLASAARLIGHPARAQMLTALLDGRALTAGELARLAGISPATASSHLGQLVGGGILTTVAQGRHRYFRIAGPDVAHGLETLATISSPQPVTTLRLSSAAAALRPARMCYDHVAGELGVRIHDHVVAIGGLDVGADGATLTAAGTAWFERLGIDATPVVGERRPAVRLCLDWTERRHHLAGALPARLAVELLDRQWLRRRRAGERGLEITPAGADGLDAILR